MICLRFPIGMKPFHCMAALQCARVANTGHLGMSVMIDGNNGIGNERRTHLLSNGALRFLLDDKPMLVFRTMFTSALKEPRFLFCQE
jgi:hypothetical protein